MMRDVPIKKNEEYIVEITGMGYEGEGIGKVHNFTIFISGAIFGEKVRTKIIKVTKNYGFGKLVEILNPSPKRRTPICEVYKRCGGCELQHMDYSFQLDLKKQRVEDCIKKIGKLEGIEIKDTIGMDNPYRYRNKVQLPVGMDKNKISIGFYAKRSHNIIDMMECHIQNEIGDKAMKLIRMWMEKYNIEPYDEETGKGIVRHIMVRTAHKTKEAMVVIVTNRNELPYKEELIETLKSGIDGIVSIIQNSNKENTNVVMGHKCITLWGKDTISDYIGEYKFNISPLSFFQVNPIQTEKLYNKVLEYADLKGNETVFDAYCGTGTISLFLSSKAKKVYGVEIVPEAIENAIENAENNDIRNAEFIVGKSEEEIPKLIERGVKADVVVVDPPRKGCDKVLLEEIAKIEPGKIVYVSCDPSTLARDLAILDSLGYRTVEIQPVDMFPQTPHVENVTLLVKE